MVRLVFYGVNHSMMYLDQPPLLIETKVFTAVPEQFRRKGVRSTWADANRPGQPTDCFIEGPSFDADGNLTDEVARGLIRDLMANLAAWARLHRKG